MLNDKCYAMIYLKKMDFNPTPQNNGQTDLLLINPDFSKNELGVASAPENHLGLNRLAGYYLMGNDLDNPDVSAFFRNGKIYFLNL